MPQTASLSFLPSKEEIIRRQEEDDDSDKETGLSFLLPFI